MTAQRWPDEAVAAAAAALAKGESGHVAERHREMARAALGALVGHAVPQGVHDRRLVTWATQAAGLDEAVLAFANELAPAGVTWEEDAAEVGATRTWIATRLREISEKGWDGYLDTAALADEQAQAVAPSVASVTGWPDWMQGPALGRSITPVVRRVIDAVDLHRARTRGDAA